MSAPRLPAAPPSGPAVATISAGVQATMAEVPAGVADGVLGALGGALLVTGEAVAVNWVGVALATGDALGTAVGLQAAIRRHRTVVATAPATGRRGGRLIDALMMSSPEILWGHCPSRPRFTPVARRGLPNAVARNERRSDRQVDSRASWSSHAAPPTPRAGSPSAAGRDSDRRGRLRGETSPRGRTPVARRRDVPAR